jgi:hypothetical protein
MAWHDPNDLRERRTRAETPAPCLSQRGNRDWSLGTSPPVFTGKLDQTVATPISKLRAITTIIGGGQVHLTRTSLRSPKVRMLSQQVIKHDH